MKHIRIGLIGTGFMGKTHLWSVQNLPFFYKTSEMGFTAEVDTYFIDLVEVPKGMGIHKE